MHSHGETWLPVQALTISGSHLPVYLSSVCRQFMEHAVSYSAIFTINHVKKCDWKMSWDAIQVELVWPALCYRRVWKHNTPIYL